MANTKLQDVQQVAVTIPNGADWAFTLVTHNLADENGNYVTPDSIIAEFSLAVGGSLWPASILIVRPPGGGGVVPASNQIGIVVLKAQNLTGNDQIFNIRVSCVRWHSIQGADHSV